MAWPNSLQAALKEWASVCSALERGWQIILLRKGGIYESSGEFEVEHREFLLFPTYVHQNLQMLKPEEHVEFEAKTAEPQKVKISAAAVVTDVVKLQSRHQMNLLYDQHVWTRPLIDMRFDYRPENPLYLMLVRVHRLHQPISLDNTPAYAGCKSWIPLDQPVQIGKASPVLDDVLFNFHREHILKRIGSL